MPGPAIDGPVVKAADPAVPAGATTKPLWELGIGVAGVRFPDYRGSDEASAYLLPLPYVAYRGRFLRADRDGARAILFAGTRVTVDVSLAASVPTRSAHNDARQGMPDLAGTFEIGPNLEVGLWQSADRRLKLDLRLPLRQAITLQSHPRGAGITFSPNLNLDGQGFGGGWQFGLLAGPVFANQRHHQYYYGVAPEFATATRPAYDAPGGFGGWRAVGAFSRRFGDLWVGGFARQDNLHGARFGPSPLVRSEHGFSAGFGMSWVFAASSQRVVADD
jgi:outer membrane scaffolding protein for murein synthesis (MipA/OmpV family)